ncbi:unnamed protein product [Mytilus edulis]|uniref:ShKT domain-containing protein n=1 Tax=Mytilus edulis TaxID=6550 RepID=A0A8S3TVL9_MYTED|nr:unnamed protein product [Mytilus edulis]
MHTDIGKSYLLDNWLIKFWSGYIQTMECYVSIGLLPVIGKRSGETTECSKCCNSSYCNLETCDKPYAKVQHYKLITPPPLPFCRDNSTLTCAANTTQCSQEYYKFYQCPYTCNQFTNAPVATMTTDLCIDFPGINCAPITCTVASIAKLCKKTCSLCSGCTDQDPIPDCQCAYLDREANLCAESDRVEDLKRFCCYFCNKKKGIFTCPDVTCLRLEKPEQAEVDRMPKPIDCISN